MQDKRFWLLTWTTYGTWLPGDGRGFVGDFQDEQGNEVRHNRPGQPFDTNIPELREHARSQMRGSPVYLNREQAKKILDQFFETTLIRGWTLWALAIMSNHLHLVVEVDGDPEPDKIMNDYKSYGTRILNRHFKKPDSDRWWTVNGSTRKLPDERAVLAAIEYVRKQSHPLLVYVHDETDTTKTKASQTKASRGA